MRILLVEDTPDLAEAIQQRLHTDGHVVDWINDGLKAAHSLSILDYALVILDLGLPNLDGISLLRYWRAAKYKTPVLVLTARSSIDDRVQVLDIGADDYLVKPVDLRELSARCRALIRRNSGEVSSVSQYGNLSYDRAAAKVLINQVEIELPKRELCLLEVFLNNLGRTLSKNHIADQLASFNEELSDNAIELYVARLRKKLAESRLTIQTLRGLGYIAVLND
ncbi:MAG: response regulator transcription factor [Thiofilum sp.]|uniref:response regulator transcription factor n=1 Tax=Thiofilum sp. TaxID=2212733 RepID=UPI0025FBFCDB|nr:response regulator transcription factor [Thiofilum sp.]MBK8455038.1 response regulator transcription factor [Thiofilum sp.]